MSNQQKQGHDLSSSIWAFWIGAAIACFSLMIYGLETNTPMDLMFWIFLAPLLLAFVATLAMMFFHYRMDGPQSTRSVSEADLEKHKRNSGDQLQLLLSLMDEEEIAAFKARLADRVLDSTGRLSDGELPYDITTLESLLEDKPTATYSD